MRENVARPFKVDGTILLHTPFARRSSIDNRIEITRQSSQLVCARDIARDWDNLAAELGRSPAQREHVVSRRSQPLRQRLADVSAPNDKHAHATMLDDAA